MPDASSETVAGSRFSRAELRRTLRRIGLWRLAATILFLLLAMLFARFSWSVPLARDAERALYDFRAVLASPHVEQDKRITLVVYTDDTLRATGKRSPLDRAVLARALRTLDAMKPKAIGIDILIDQAQPEDAELIAAFRAIKTPTYLGFASNATNGTFMQLWQEEFLRGFLRSIHSATVKPASIRFEADKEDNVERSWPSQPATLPPLLANAMVPFHPAFRDYRGSIRYRLPLYEDRGVFNKLPIDLFALPAIADQLRSKIEGRYVLIGGDISDVDQFETPATRISGETTTGLEIHATMLAQLLDDVRLTIIPGWALWLGALLIVPAGALTSLGELAPLRLAAVLIGQLLLGLGIPVWLQFSGVDTQELPMFGWAVGWIFAFAAAGTAAKAVGSEERLFAQAALGKYLPRDVVQQILRDPEQLALHGEKRRIFALFTDLEGFTKLSHAIPPELVATLLNRYLDMMSEIVLKHGGTLDKFVGDAVVAFWGAPIARPDDGDRALRAAIEMHEAGEGFRRPSSDALPALGRTRIGLHCGDAVVGNFGGEDRIQYTALGDAMNTASRLEAANKRLGTAILISQQARERIQQSALRPLGRILLRGRSTPVDIFEPVDAAENPHVTDLTALLRRFDDGDPHAIADLEKVSEARPDDRALAQLLDRLRKIGPGGYFVLD
ncbi:adenylate/guanylate cyclase domain-containing protein [Flavisphingomonas formosensis]|uniref:adenylate/guanylate cyclase domain-containing protein n=1 Tax=Flavisphingomonas formosensis TaxID=861534 RepID=UPI001E591C86|nr:adenylate/guanylate cyclase domain-containing protein [Sphingomonas formosensis]